MNRKQRRELRKDKNYKYKNIYFDMIKYIDKNKNSKQQPINNAYLNHHKP